MDYTFSSLLANDGFLCPDCGRRHFGLLKDCHIGDGVLGMLPQILTDRAVVHPFVLCDRDTHAAAGAAVCSLLTEADLDYTLHIVERTKPAPDERLVGEAHLFCDLDCDAVIAVGGGVMNDIGKLVASARKIPDIYVSTAPSMDGFASCSSSMERCGFKLSIPSQCPDVILADTAILSAAPAHMICAGIGDMVAKYISVTEWEIASVLFGEYYCPTIAAIVRKSLAQCVKSAKGALVGDKEAVARLVEGLTLSGMTMNYAGITRPASGMEHYISHICDMRALAFGTPADLHGIQCGIGTLTALRAYEKLAEMTPDRAKALAHARDFDSTAWFAQLHELLGHGADAMEAWERGERIYAADTHTARLDAILTNWEPLRAIMRTLPSSAWLAEFFRDIGHPTTLEEIGLTHTDLQNAFRAARDVRNKYVLGSLLWDLGLLEAFTEEL